MTKKRFLIAVFLLAVILFSSNVLAGCCVGVSSCSRAFFASECSSLATFQQEECEEKEQCDVVACCHDIIGIPKATYRATCAGISQDLSPAFLQKFITNPASLNAAAEKECISPSTPICKQKTCGGTVDAGCLCGNTEVTGSNQFCCAQDNAFFSSAGECSFSPSCTVEKTVDITGSVLSFSNQPVVGATVSIGGLSVFSDDVGDFKVVGVPFGSSGKIIVSKGLVINNSESYQTIDDNDLDVGVIYLDYVLEFANENDCFDGVDDDKDQFGWDSSIVNSWMVPGSPQYSKFAADRCDPDCAVEIENSNKGWPHVEEDAQVVTSVYYLEGDEFEGDKNNPIHDVCSDNLDNDCDGLTDCEEESCKENSPACQNSYCGDYVVQAPNSEGEYEQCDAFDGLGVDSLCPGKCIPPDQPRGCTCEHEVVCGNEVIDEPFEECDGKFIPAINEWTSQSGCSDGSICGKPGSKNPCMCSVPQVCGNGIPEPPEQCDLKKPIEEWGSECNMDCTIPQEAICGDGVLQIGEDCDGTWLNDPWSKKGQIYPESSKYAGFGYWVPESFKTRSYGCVPTKCGAPVSIVNGIDGPEGIGQTSYKADQTNALGDSSFGYEALKAAQGDIESCMCPLNCEINPPGPTMNQVGIVQWDKGFVLSWNDECKNAVNYNIYRCRADSLEDLESGICSLDEDINKRPKLTGEYISINTELVGDKIIDNDYDVSIQDEQHYYCYAVEGNYDVFTPEKTFVSKLNKTIHCVPAGHKECYELQITKPHSDEFCYTNVRYTCDENNSRTPVESKGLGDIFDCATNSMMCVGPYDDAPALDPKRGKTECIDRSICSYCSDPFGIFAYSGPSLGNDWYDGSDGNYGRAPNDPNDDSRRDYGYCSNIEYCYLDYSYTSVNTFYGIEDKTCYDMRSENACDNYNEIIGSEECQWMPSPDFIELGIGVCSPIDTEKQNCSRCHDPLNEVFGFCDTNICGLYGKCYYDEPNLGDESKIFREKALIREADQISTDEFRMCRPESEISCASYDSENDCVNSDSIYSLDSTTQIKNNVSINVETEFIHEDYNVINRFSGTNELSTNSDDYFNFSECFWDRKDIADPTADDSYPRCAKNSDGSPMKEVIEIHNGEEFIEHTPLSDCGGIDSDWDDENDLMKGNLPDTFPNDCRKDTQDPITTLVNIPSSDKTIIIGGAFSTVAKVADNSLEYLKAPLDESIYPKTYSCIYDGDNDCYPNSSGQAYFSSESAGNIVNHTNTNKVLSYDYDAIGHLETGYHTLKYYSEDISHNLEIVQTINLFVDADAPNVEFSFKNESYEIYEDVWRTNLTITMNIVSRQGIENDDDKATCYAQLYVKGTPIYPNQAIFPLGEYGESWDFDFKGMVDGLYYLNYSCFDSVNNRAEGLIEFIINGDRSIVNPSPKGTFANPIQTIQVETGSNAECKYIENLAPQEFNEEGDLIPQEPEFRDMFEFSLTGSTQFSQTIHNSDLTHSAGFHRYQVRCNIFNDDKVRGNNGDDIIFAIDNIAPITDHFPVGNFYNGWFNDDVSIELTCQDVPIMGQGLDWSFGCEEIHYCLGKSCYEWGDQEYTDKINIDETTYLSYYSIDKGWNKEDWVRDIIFNIDKTDPIVNISFYETTKEGMIGEPVDVIVLNTLYTVVVNSSKELVPASVNTPIVYYGSDPAFLDGEIAIYPTTDPSIWKGQYVLKNTNANRGYEGFMNLNVDVLDYHAREGTGYKEIYVDTKAPDQPVLLPSLTKPSSEESEYQLADYPINYIDGVYYTSERSLFLTGYTSELTEVEVVVGTDKVDTPFVFNQKSNIVAYQDKALFGLEFGNNILIQGDIRKTKDDLTIGINDSLFIGFDKENLKMGPRVDYGSFGIFYDITEITYEGGDNDYTRIEVEPALQEGIPVNREIMFYQNNKPSFWFGINATLPELKTSEIYVKATDWVGNLVRFPEIPERLTIFSDPYPPQVVASSPVSGSTSRNTFNISVVVSEKIDGSGIYNDSIRFEINGEEVSYSLEEWSKSNNFGITKPGSDERYYRIMHQAINLQDNLYTVRVYATDKAGNYMVEETASADFFFDVDSRYPFDPNVTFEGGFKSPFGGNRWYVRESPDFIVNFSNEKSDVTITGVSMMATPTENGAATCEELVGKTNIFKCKFDQRKTTGGSFWSDYGVIVSAYKTLSDGSISPTGKYGPFEFTIDDAAPVFSFSLMYAEDDGIVLGDRFMDNINLSIFANVINEHHPLEASLRILGEDFKPYYSDNDGQFYRFLWQVPNYDKNQEGEHPLVLTLSDFAKNSNSESINVTLDLTPPSVDGITIEMSDTIPIGDELFTSASEVTVSGRIIDDDVAAIWIIPGESENLTSGDGQVVAEIEYDGIIPKRFSVVVPLPNPEIGLVENQFLYNEMLVNSINKMTLYIRDYAGHTNHMQLKIVRDVAPPLEPAFCIGGNFEDCKLPPLKMFANI